MILPLLLALLMGTCYWARVRQEGALAPSQTTKVPAQLPDPTALPAAEAGPTASPQSIPSPEQVAPTPLSQAAFTLTILYTGEVYGEILPCPG
jgi:hypothetical protein